MLVDKKISQFFKTEYNKDIKVGSIIDFKKIAIDERQNMRGYFFKILDFLYYHKNYRALVLPKEVVEIVSQISKALNLIINVFPKGQDFRDATIKELWRRVFQNFICGKYSIAYKSTSKDDYIEIINKTLEYLNHLNIDMSEFYNWEGYNE